VRILGIDPGLNITGYGCIDAADGHVELVEAGLFRLGARPARSELKVPIPRTVASVSSRLLELDRDLRDLLGRVQPQVVAVESLFAHYKHPATAIVMGHARGVMLLAIRRAGLELAEFRPALVKKSMTGNGQARKDQMQRAVQSFFDLAQPPEPPDVADALAIAVCAARRLSLA